MSPRLRSIVPHALLLLLALLLYWAASTIDTSAAAGSGGFGPDAWPKFVVAAMALLCVVEIVRRLGSGGSAGAAGRLPESPAARGSDSPRAVDGAAGGATDAPARAHPARLAAGLALIAGFVVAVPHVGFFATTALFLAAFIQAAGLHRPLLAAGIGLIGAFVLVVVFMRVAYISLPLGTGPFRDLSIGLLKLIGA